MNQFEISQLYTRYGKREVLRGLDLRFAPGQISVIIGANGCGKSTLLRCLARLHRPYSGIIKLADHDLWNYSIAQTAHLLAFLPQHPQAPNGLDVTTLVRYGRHPYQGWLRQWSAADEVATQQAMQACDIVNMADRRFDQLSGGQRQRCWLAMIFAQQTPFLLLDEPTSALDLGHQIEILNLLVNLARQGRGIILVLHDLAAAARYADQLIVLQKGALLASGQPHKIITKTLVKQLYGISADILHAPDDQAPVIVPRYKKL